MAGFVSAGTLPPVSARRAALQRVHEECLPITEGRNSQVYPALAGADASHFGISLYSVAGAHEEVGDVTDSFVIMSVSKPFVLALVCQDHGWARAGELLGMNATGRPFNSVEAIYACPGGRTNPMVNPGAIATTSHVLASSAAERWQRIHATMSAFAGRELGLDEQTYANVAVSNQRNRVILAALAERGLLGCDPEEALDLYGRQCCLEVTCGDLAVMGATLANGGRNPVTGVQVIEGELCHPVLAAMLTAGMYEDSGSWLYRVGLPAKSGIGGGIVAVSPGKGGLGVYSPPLDAAGNSVRGVQAAMRISTDLGLDLLASRPED